MTEPIDHIRYEPDERCPWPIALSVGSQGVAMVLTSIVLVVTVVSRASGEPIIPPWTLFASLVIAGVATIAQAGRLGRLGTGYPMIMAPTLTFTALIALAIDAGGPGLSASLVVAASLVLLVLGHWLPKARRVITPTVSGTMVMLIAATLLRFAFEPMQQVNQGSPRSAGTIIAAVTIATAILLAWWARGVLRLWSPLVSVASGCTAAALLGVYELGPVRDAAWIGLPSVQLPGLVFALGTEFWSLLPAFVLVALVGGLRNIGDGIAVQLSSRRKARATDFRAAQRSLYTEGLGTLASGIAGTPPIVTYGGESVALATFTGIASRRVGYMMGMILILLAGSPKITSVLVALPDPVVGAYLLVMVALMFISGIRTVVNYGLDSKSALIVGISFCVGVGVDAQPHGAALSGTAWELFLGNGIVAGAICAMAMSIGLHVTKLRKGRTRLDVDLGEASLREIDDFVVGIASRLEWNEQDAHRLRAASEESLHSLIGLKRHPASPDTPGLIIRAEPSSEMVVLEFIAVFDAVNIEDRLANLSDETGDSTVLGADLPLRLLRHYASSVHHQQYYGLDVVTVQIRSTSRGRVTIA